MRRRTIFVIVTLVIAAASPAHADRSGGFAENQNGEDVTEVRAYREVVETRHRSGTRTYTCTYRQAGVFPVPITIPDLVEFESGHEGEFVEDFYYWMFCRNGADELVAFRIFRFTPGVPPVSSTALAVEAVDQLDPPHPLPRTNPGIDLDQIVGIETWMWVDPASWVPITATASVPPLGPFPGLTVTATATPERVVWDMGDGTAPVACEGPGTPYDTTRPAAGQSTECWHVYQRFGTYRAAATMVWSVTWTSSDGDGGTLADISRTTAFDMGVAERQAVGR